MKSSESLESRLTSFLMESALKLADLISADVFVLIDAPGNCVPHETHHRSARIWSGASSLRSAFLRDGLRARESDVEFAAPAASMTSASSLGLVQADKSTRVVDFGSVLATDPELNSERNGRIGQSPDFLPGVASSTPEPTSFPSSSSRRKRRPPSKRKTRLKPKFSRLDLEGAFEEDEDHRDYSYVDGDDRNVEDDAVPLNLSFIDKPPNQLDGSAHASHFHWGSGAPTPANSSSSSASTISSSAVVTTAVARSPQLTAALPTPVSPNLPSSPLPPLETGSTSTSITATARESFDFSFTRGRGAPVAASSSPARNGDPRGSDGDGRSSHVEPTSALSDHIASACINFEGLMDLTPPEREPESDENHEATAVALRGNAAMNGAMERAMAAAAAAAAAQVPVHALYGLAPGCPPPLGGPNEDYYANITQSLFSMLSHYSPAVPAARNPPKPAGIEEKTGGGEGVSGEKGAGVVAGIGGAAPAAGQESANANKGESGGGRGGRKRKELSPAGDITIDALLTEKSPSGSEGALEDNGLGGATSNGVAEQTAGNKPGRPRGKTSSENRRGKSLFSFIILFLLPSFT